MILSLEQSSLSGWFFTTSGHKAVAAKVHGALGYITIAGTNQRMLDTMRGTVGELPEIRAAQVVVDRYKSITDQLSAEISRAAPEADRSSSVPPSGYDVQDWRLAEFVNESTLDQLLPLADQANLRAEEAVNAAATAERAARRSNGENVKPWTPGPGQTPIDWSQPGHGDIEPRPWVEATAKNVKKAADDAAGRVGIGIGVVLLVAAGVGLFILRRKL